ncbi:mitochondrial carrier [Microstroma glucosiphilum]|uniref:Mitochondrial carrier n=1 Tax=Pseudomicrostroma glucosiphilum TaxID=1684307 RepID=A0A316U802_9BASI|nr:mitochondrial carrier [Pseudomicrostroma glucosiphilum]PWN20581.1 mitochondrial carrier [Pseudomicrostroma glucosiphilum]
MATSSASAAPSSSEASQARPPLPSDGQAAQPPLSDPSLQNLKRTRTLYNTFLSPSGSTSFFTGSWFESRPIRNDSSSSSKSSLFHPSSSSSSSTSSDSDSAESSYKNFPRRSTYEQYRSQEPPQARLIRLRGLFDVLMDNQRDALADGRAKEAWTATARSARYGAGGSLARGTWAAKEAADKERTRNRNLSEKERRLDADKTDPALATTTTTASPEAVKEPAVPSPPSQGYAKELLAQCRQCRQELEEEREKRRRKHSDRDSEESSSSGFWSNIWGSSSSQSEAVLQEHSGDANALLSLWYSMVGPPAGQEDQRPLEADYDGESGYTGSQVWGLSSVKGSSRDRERQSSRREEAQAKSPNSETEKEEELDEDGHYARALMIEWEGFLKYAETKERELYKIFCELDRNGDMRLDAAEVRQSLNRAGIDLPPASLEDFIASLSSSTRTSNPHEHWTLPDTQNAYISWPEFRDYLLLLPRRTTVTEIFRFYQVRKAYGLFGVGGVFSDFGNNWGKTHRHGATTVTSDGDVSLAGEEKKRSETGSKSASSEERRTGSGSISDSKVSSDDKSKDAGSSSAHDGADGHHGDEEEEEEDNDMIHSDVALKFLLAGGIAGAISRTATAPFDRLKVYLITASRSEDTATAGALKSVKQGQTVAAKDATKVAAKGMGVIGSAVTTLYREGGGLKAFWLGNGLNCIKIFPESAIKFLSYEMSKRAFAKYVDGVSDSRDISGTSRFISGGIGGISSQLAIYPVETLKTRLMSSQGSKAPISPKTGQRMVGEELLKATARDMWKAGPWKTYYRGLTLGLVGVFPYSAIDMSTFEGIKLAYISWSGKEEPGTLALLAFGSISGSIGATTVYPLNLIRTRLQAAGTPAHPQVYTGFLDAWKRTYVREGFVGFYRGLIPTLAKVVPAVSISYVCYENSKKRLGVA